MMRKNNTKRAVAPSTGTTEKIRNKFVSFPKASEMLGVGIATVRCFARSFSTLETFTYGDGMHPMISRSSVEKLLAKREAAR